MTKLKKRIYEILQEKNTQDIATKVFNIVIVTLIALNIFQVVVETFTLSAEIRVLFRRLEIVSTLIFTVEYALRLWTSDFLFPALPKKMAGVRYIFTGMALIDLLAILPFYLPFIIPLDLRYLRLLRMFRLLRILKIARYTSSFALIGSVLKEEAGPLLSSLFGVGILMMFTSVIMYNIEAAAQPEVFKNAFSGLWWAVVTLTTVGYGDIYPVTAMGKILSGIIAFLGIGLVAVPTGIISAGFMEQMERAQEKDYRYCPHCGKKLK